MFKLLKKKISNWFKMCEKDDNEGVWFHAVRRNGKMCIDINDHYKLDDAIEAVELLNRIFHIGEEVKMKSGV